MNRGLRGNLYNLNNSSNNIFSIKRIILIKRIVIIYSIVLAEITRQALEEFFQSREVKPMPERVRKKMEEQARRRRKGRKYKFELNDMPQRNECFHSFFFALRFSLDGNHGVDQNCYRKLILRSDCLVGHAEATEISYLAYLII